MNIDRLIRSFVDRKWLLICIFVIPARDLSSLLQKEQISQFLCAKVMKKTVQVTLCKISGSPAGDNDSVILAGLELSPSPMRWRSLTLRCRVCLLFVTPNQHKKVFVLYIPGMWKIFLLMLKFFFLSWFLGRRIWVVSSCAGLGLSVFYLARFDRYKSSGIVTQ